MTQLGFFAELELFPGRRYLDPHLMNTGERSFRKRKLQRILMQTQVSRYYTEFPLTCCFVNGGVRIFDIIQHFLFEEA